ncbi:hypothetical protein Vretifemale_18441, partial [Volvox reticuliferus]
GALELAERRQTGNTHTGIRPLGDVTGRACWEREKGSGSRPGGEESPAGRNRRVGDGDPRVRCDGERVVSSAAWFEPETVDLTLSSDNEEVAYGSTAVETVPTMSATSQDAVLHVDAGSNVGASTAAVPAVAATVAASALIAARDGGVAEAPRCCGRKDVDGGASVQGGVGVDRRGTSPRQQQAAQEGPMLNASFPPEQGGGPRGAQLESQVRWGEAKAAADGGGGPAAAAAAALPADVMQDGRGGAGGGEGGRGGEDDIMYGDEYDMMYSSADGWGNGGSAAAMASGSPPLPLRQCGQRKDQGGLSDPRIRQTEQQPGLEDDVVLQKPSHHPPPHPPHHHQHHQHHQHHHHQQQQHHHHQQQQQQSPPATLTQQPPHPPPPQQQFLARFCAAWIYASMATVGVSLLERQRRYGEAVALLRQLLQGRCCPGRRGEWWMRMSLDLQHLGREEEALQVAEAALTDPWVRHGDRLALQRRVLRLGKPPRRWRRPPWAASAQAEPREVVVSATMIKGAAGGPLTFLPLPSPSPPPLLPFSPSLLLSRSDVLLSHITLRRSFRLQSSHSSCPSQ